MTVSPLLPANNRWLLTLLAAAFGIDVLLALGSSGHDLGALPGAALMALCALLGARQPVQGAVAGAFVLGMSTVFIRLTGTRPESLGISDLLLTEMASGVTLVVLVVWRATPALSTACTALLVGSALFSSTLRTERGGRLTQFQSLQLGLLMLIAAVGIGIYLRSVGRKRNETELNTLVRRQWPLAAALALTVLLDLNIGGGSTRLVALGGALVAAVCAFFAPRAPVSLTLAATAGISLAPFVLYATDGVLPGRGSGESFVLTEIAASMALIAYVIRWAPKWPAAFSTAGLAAANVLAIQLRNLSGTADTRPVGQLSEIGLYLMIFLVIAIATGLYFRSRDRERTQSVRSAVTGAQQSERLALARELHDVVAHHVTGIVVQAQAAKLVSDKNPQAAVQALAKIETSGVEALKAMRFLVASMRGAKPAGTSEATEQATTNLVADLNAVVENFSGPDVRLDLDTPEVLPIEVGRSVLRLVQESLTNVGKHALGARSVVVRVSATSTELHVQVADDGTGRRTDPVGGSGGYGLVGMRERVELLGGRFSAGPAEPVGWQVDAWLPIREEDLT